jgi:glucose-1-phosphate cytidylyltransferase
MAKKKDGGALRRATKREQVVILCGGQGTRMREETEFRPKALVEIGGRPVLWHLMKHYDRYGYRRFVLLLGYRGAMIKQWFLDYHWLVNDFTLKLGNDAPRMKALGREVEDWEITFVETGLETQTGGRLKRAEDAIEGRTFLANYCDGLSDVDLDAVVAFHRRHGKAATLTGFHPRSKYGVVKADKKGVVDYFQEKPMSHDLTSGGFFVFDRRIFSYLDRDCVLETGPFERLAAERQMALYEHDGFWQCMDTFKEAQALNALWSKGDAPWRTWRD